MYLTHFSVAAFYILSATFVAFGFGLGLVVAPGKSPHRLYVVGTIIALSAAALLALEFYVLVLGPAMREG